jgi:iron complex transport system permease protein
MSFLFSSLVLLILAISRSEKVHSAILWLMGDLSSTANSLILTMPLIIFLGISILAIFGRDIDLLTLGEEKATHLGLDINNVKKIIFVVTSFITAICVSYAGIIGFVGLIIPHFMRFLFGPKHRINIITSALGGASFLILSDTTARTIIRPVELPVGVVTGILGGIFFLSILIKSKRWEIF